MIFLANMFNRLLLSEQVDDSHTIVKDPQKLISYFFSDLPFQGMNLLFECENLEVRVTSPP